MKYYFPFIITPIVYLFAETKAKVWIAFFLALNSLLHYIVIEVMSKVLSIPAKVRYEFKDKKEKEKFKTASRDLILEIKPEDIEYVPEILNKAMKITYIICVTFLLAGIIILIENLLGFPIFAR